MKFQDLGQCAKTFFEKEKASDSNLPFVFFYPKNCCEVASAFVGVALTRFLPQHPIQVAKAYSYAKNEWHFWVEAGDQVIDITAHQFDEYEDIVVCEKPSPLEQAFPDIEYASAVEVLQGLSRIPSVYAEEVIIRLIADFEAATR